MIVTFERDIKNELKKLDKEITDTLKEDFGKETKSIKDTFTKVLSHIADILFKTSLKHDEWHHEINKDKQFSFFPGYVNNQATRIFNVVYRKINANTKEENKLDLLSIDDYNKLKKDEQDKYEEVDLDFWFNNETTNSITYQNSLKKSKNISLLSLAYHFLFLGKGNFDLTTELDETKKNIKALTFSYEIGGTHQWASQIADEIAINDALDPLTLLAFYDNKKDSRDNQLKYKSWINIPFQLKGADSEELERYSEEKKRDLTEEEKVIRIQDEIYSWCESVVNKLNFPSNTKEVDNIKEKWPFNPNCYRKFNNDKYILIYRAYIVAFWMQMVLRPERFLKIENKKIKSVYDNLEVRAWFNFMDFIQSKIESATNLKISNKDYESCFKFRQGKIDKFKSLLNEPSNSEQIIAHNYKYWYTIPFRHRLDFSDNNYKKDTEFENRKETGSAMILSNYLLDGEYFRFIIPWLNQMYDAMREYDTARDAANKKLLELKNKINSQDLTIEQVLSFIEKTTVPVDNSLLVRG